MCTEDTVIIAKNGQNMIYVLTAVLMPGILYLSLLSQMQGWVTGQLADTPTRGLDILRTGQLADAIGDFACLVFVLLVASARPRVVQSATCPVCELTSALVL